MLVERPRWVAASLPMPKQSSKWSLNSVLLSRVGNRSWVIAPQGIYRVMDVARDDPALPTDDWVAVSVETDEQWAALTKVVGDDGLAHDSELITVSGRQARHDRIDAAISTWCRSRSGSDIVAELLAAGVPAAQVLRPESTPDVVPVVARGLFERVVHPVVGEMRIIGFPARFSSGPDRWHRIPSPCLGEHNREVLGSLLGFSSEEIDVLDAAEVIGSRTYTNLGW